MYFKMAINNVKKSFKDYTIYFLTLTFAVCIFYSFNSIESQTIMFEMSKSQEDYIKLTQKLLSGVSIFVSVILGGLIIYATNFLIKRRKKEFGIYMTLGMSKWKISIILFMETLIIGAISLLAGLFLGIMLAQGLSLITAKLFAVEMSNFKFIISTSAVIKSITYFGIIYFMVMIFNVFVISRYKLIDLISAIKKSEKIRIRNPFIAIGILVIAITVLGIAYYLVIVSKLNFKDVRFSISIIMGIVGTLGFFYGLASVVLFFIQRSKNTYLNKLNIFTTRQITSKFNTNFISMTVVCLMLFITIGILTSGLSIKKSFESSLEAYTPFDATLMVNEHSDKKVIPIMDAIKELNLDVINNSEHAVIKGYSLDISTKDLIGKYTDNNSEVINHNPAFKETEVLTLSDFNKNRKLLGKELLELNEDELYVISNVESVIPTVERFLKNENVVNIDNKEYKIKNEELIEDSIITSLASNVVFTLILPDSLLEGITPRYDFININFIGEDKEKSKEYLNKFLEDIEYNDLDFSLMGFTREIAYEASVGISTMILFISIYLGIVFLLSSAAVLALQQLSQCNESLDRYVTLRKIGASKKLINRSILTEVLTFFMLPLSLGIVHSIVGVKVIEQYLRAYGEYDIIYSALITGLIFFIVYGGYFYATYIGYKNIVNNE